MKTFQFINQIKLSSVTLSKNILLIFWIYLLLGLGIEIASGKTRLMMDQLIDSPLFGISNQDLQQKTQVINPSQVMDDYLSKNYKSSDEMPPLGLVLDQIQIYGNWRNPKKNITRNEYLNLFKTIEFRLKAIAINNIEDLNSIQIEASILPKNFRGGGFDPKHKSNLPLEAQSWIEAEAKRIQKKAQRLNLLDTFLLLIILGGFGSLIFLIREHMENEQDIPIKSYIYRPILGMSLALAIFITDASIHTLISEAEIENIKRETLFLLAFAAGLVSEQAYSLIVHRAREVLKNESENEELDEQELSSRT